MDGIAKGGKYRENLPVDSGIGVPDVGNRYAEILREGTRSIDPDTAGVSTEVASSCQTIPAAATDDVSFAGDDVPDFEVELVQESRGLKLELHNAPAKAFVDGRMIQGIRSHLFTTLRDIVYIHHKLVEQQRFDLDSGTGITDAVFRILRNADIVSSNKEAGSSQFLMKSYVGDSNGMTPVFDNAVGMK